MTSFVTLPMSSSIVTCLYILNKNIHNISSYYFEFISVCCDLNVPFVRLRVHRPYDTSVISRC
jgi:hypothetical protein